MHTQQLVRSSILFLVVFVMFGGIYFFQQHRSLESNPTQPRELSSTTPPAVNTPQIATTSEQIPMHFISAIRPGSVSLLHFGDAMFDRGVRKRMRDGTDVFSAFRELSIMQDYDIRILNLEGPIVEIPRSQCQQKAYTFQFPLNTATLLKQEGFTHTTIANNHIYDCYAQGASSTRTALAAAEIQTFGFPGEHIATSTYVGDTLVTLIGYDNTVGHISFSEIERAVQTHRKTSDILLISVHFGNEYEPIAHASQERIAHRLIDLGADIIVGHHPHVVQNWELYKGRPIFYSLGNFIFDQIGEKENFGFGVGITFTQDTIDLMLYPYTINNSIPTPLPMQQANAWCRNYYESYPYVNVQGCLATIEEQAKNTP
jgi:poly-gamma-glutamate synthesis protein (capsule biosynthesis protein)